MWERDLAIKDLTLGQVLGEGLGKRMLLSRLGGSSKAAVRTRLGQLAVHTILLDIFYLSRGMIIDKDSMVD